MTFETRRGFSPRFRLQLILALMIAWDALGLLAELSFGGFLFKLSDAEIKGLISARGAFNGALIVPLILYVYAMRNPQRYRGLLWIGVVEQITSALAAVYHGARDDVAFGGVMVTLVVAIVLLVMLLLNMPRGQTT